VVAFQGEEPMKLSRRSFLKNSTAAAAAMTVAPTMADIISAAEPVPMTPGPGNKWPGRVVVNFHGAAASGTTADGDVIRQMVTQSILRLTGETSVGEAWKAIFPATLSLQSKIAIKIGLLNPVMHRLEPYTIMAITEGLQQMVIDGQNFPAGNICLYDGNNPNKMDSVGLTEEKLPGIKRTHYGKTTATLGNDYFHQYGDGARNASYAPILSSPTGADFLIDLFTLRGHNMYGADGVTLGFKNHYGSYQIIHAADTNHQTDVSTYLRDINCSGPIYQKTVLSFCSAIFGTQLNADPTAPLQTFAAYAKKLDASVSNNCNPTTIIMSTDPISAEVQAWKILRINGGKPYDISSMPKYLQASGGVAGALSPTYNIGQIDEAKMDIRKFINGQASAVREPLHQTGASATRLTVSPLRGQNSTFIEFLLPDAHLGSEASIEIFNARGALVRRIVQRVLGALNHCSWDNRDSGGVMVSAGMYIVRLVAGDVNLAAKASIVS
jgi:hypothetical protein